MERLPGLVAPKTESRPPRLGRVPVVHALGPEFAGLRQAVAVSDGPGTPPPGFVGATTSAEEWMIYWALATVERDPRDPRQPPFFGGRNWGYQLAILGRYARAAGSAVPDFVYYAPGQRLALRVVTRYWHIAQGPQVKALDRIQRERMERGGYRVVDLFADDFVDDRSGQAAILLVKEALGLRERVNPVAAARSLARG